MRINSKLTALPVFDHSVVVTLLYVLVGIIHDQDGDIDDYDDDDGNDDQDDDIDDDNDNGGGSVASLWPLRGSNIALHPRWRYDDQMMMMMTMIMMVMTLMFYLWSRCGCGSGSAC